MQYIAKTSAISLSEIQHESGKKNVTNETNLAVDNTWKDLCHLLGYHVLVKKEAYSLAQVRNVYDELRRELGEEVTKPRSIDIKK